MDVNKIIYKVVKVIFTVLLVVSIVYGTAIVSFTAFDFGYRVFTEPAMEYTPGTDVIVTVTDSMDENDIAKMLQEEGLIRDANLFYLQLKLSAYSGELLPGTYTLNTSMQSKEMMIIIAQQEEDLEE